MNTTYKRNCPVCSSNNKILLYKQLFANVSKVSFISGYDVVLCETCGFAYADNIPDQAAFDEYYENQSKYENNTTEINHSRNEVIQNTYNFIKRHINHNDINIAEFGCGSGDVLRHLKEIGYNNLTAIEPSQICVNRLNEVYQINAIKGTIADINVKEKFDLLMILTVLEHVVDIDKTLKNISEILSDNGLLYIRVPNANRFAEYDDSPFQQFSPEHINYFTNISVKNLMAKYGFVLLDFEEVGLSETDNTILPMINLMFLKNIKAKTHMIERDNSSYTNIKKYLEKSTLKELEVNRKINVYALSGEPIIVWGVGMHTMRLLELGALKKCNIIAFIDSNIHYNGGSFQNIPILSPSELKKFQNKILISSKVFQNEIADLIKNDLKALNELILLY